MGSKCKHTGKRTAHNRGLLGDEPDYRCEECGAWIPPPQEPQDEAFEILAREVAAMRRIIEVKARKVNARTFAAACKSADLTRAWLALPKASAATDANELARRAVEEAR